DLRHRLVVPRQLRTVDAAVEHRTDVVVVRRCRCALLPQVLADVAFVLLHAVLPARGDRYPLGLAAGVAGTYREQALLLQVVDGHEYFVSVQRCGEELAVATGTGRGACGAGVLVTAQLGLVRVSQRGGTCRGRPVGRIAAVRPDLPDGLAA